MSFANSTPVRVSIRWVPWYVRPGSAETDWAYTELPSSDTRTCHRVVGAATGMRAGSVHSATPVATSSALSSFAEVVTNRRRPSGTIRGGAAASLTAAGAIEGRPLWVLFWGAASHADPTRLSRTTSKTGAVRTISVRAGTGPGSRRNCPPAPVRSIHESNATRDQRCRRANARWVAARPPGARVPRAPDPAAYRARHGGELGRAHRSAQAAARPARALLSLQRRRAGDGDRERRRRDAQGAAAAARRSSHRVGAHAASRRAQLGVLLDAGGLPDGLRILRDGRDGSHPEPHRRRDRRSGAALAARARRQRPACLACRRDGYGGAARELRRDRRRGAHAHRPAALRDQPAARDDLHRWRRSADGSARRARSADEPRGLAARAERRDTRRDRAAEQALGHRRGPGGVGALRRADQTTRDVRVRPPVRSERRGDACDGACRADHAAGPHVRLSRQPHPGEQ